MTSHLFLVSMVAGGEERCDTCDTCDSFSYSNSMTAIQSQKRVQNPVTKRHMSQALHHLLCPKRLLCGIEGSIGINYLWLVALPGTPTELLAMSKFMRAAVCLQWPSVGNMFGMFKISAGES
jgi:hypothetical protein